MRRTTQRSNVMGFRISRRKNDKLNRNNRTITAVSALYEFPYQYYYCYRDCVFSYDDHTSSCPVRVTRSTVISKFGPRYKNIHSFRLTVSKY